MFECEELKDDEYYKCSRDGTSVLYEKFTYVILKTGERVYITSTTGEYCCWRKSIGKYQLFSDNDINHYKTMLLRVAEKDDEIKEIKSKAKDMQLELNRLYEEFGIED